MTHGNVLERECEKSIMKVTLYTSHNIDQLSEQDKKALEETYQTSYRNSIWSKASPEIMQWYDSQESKEWFIEAQDFYIELVKKGNCEIALSTDVRTGEIIAGLFTMNGKVFLEHANTDSSNHLQEILQKMGADPEKTIYVGELFVNPKYRGIIGGAAIFKMALELRAPVFSAGIKHVVAWTIDRKDNVMIPMYKRIGLKESPDGRIEKGIDLYMNRNGKESREFTKSGEGPALYFNGTVKQVSNFLARFSQRSSSN